MYHNTERYIQLILKRFLPIEEFIVKLIIEYRQLKCRYIAHKTN